MENIQKDCGHLEVLVNEGSVTVPLERYEELIEAEVLNNMITILLHKDEEFLVDKLLKIFFVLEPHGEKKA